MAFKNSYAVYINGINRTHNAIMPLKWGNFLDERLDECYLSLRRIKVKTFSPLTPVEIVLSNKLWFHQSDTPTETTGEEERTKYFIVANDSAKENPFGSGYYDHDLYLIEVTKVAECVICDTMTITNDLGRDYTSNAKPVEPVESSS